jgi:hypothetical protein
MSLANISLVITIKANNREGLRILCQSLLMLDNQNHFAGFAK